MNPATVSVVTDCSAPIEHPAGLTEAGLMESGMLMSRIDRLKFSAEGVDKVVGVVPTGWFSRQLIDGFAEAVGIAPQGGGMDAAIVERQNTGGWVVAHELAHNYGWTETPGAHDMHLDDEPAPGYWVVERRDIPSSTLDIMQFNTAGADVTQPHWALDVEEDVGLPHDQALDRGDPGLRRSGDALSISGSVSQSGAVTAGPAYELPGEAGDADGPLTFEQLDADGGVLQTRKFGAVNKLGPIGNATSKGDKHIVTKDAAFSLQVPALPAARSLRIRRGEDVLLSRARSAAAPVVERRDAGARRDRRRPDAQLDGDRRRRRHAHLAGLDLARRWPDLALAGRRDHGHVADDQGDRPARRRGHPRACDHDRRLEHDVGGVGRVHRRRPAGRRSRRLQRLHERRDLDREHGRQRSEADLRPWPPSALVA